MLLTGSLGGLPQVDITLLLFNSILLENDKALGPDNKKKN